MMNTLNWLQNWYLENCNGVWEHSYRLSQLKKREMKKIGSIVL